MKIKGIVKQYLWKIILGIVGLIMICVGVAYYIDAYLVYNQIEVIESYANEDAGDGNYEKYLDGVLKCSRDGIAFLSEHGEEIWNQPCQMSYPILEICRDTVAVADKGGTSIFVFQKKGLKGEIQTTLPIEKISVSSQGIVAAILKNGESPKVLCYDADGNVLVEHKASLSEPGYPVDVALSQDGNVLTVSYLGTKGSSVVSRVNYYNFGEAGEGKKDYQVASMEYVDSIIPTITFLDKTTSMLVADHSIIFMEGLEEPKELFTVPIEKEIKQVTYNEEYIALLLKNSGQTNYELCIYSDKGKLVFSTQFDGEYANMKIIDDQVVMFEGNRCAIYNQYGTCKYEGELGMNIVSMFPVSGFQKYIVISANGFQEIQLVK